MLTKKGINQLGSKFNESAGSKVSDFALKQMQKFGWKEGQGLGKNEDGIVKHIKAVKKEENTGIGRDAEIMKDANTEWWHDAYSTGLKAVKSKKSKKRKSADTEATEGSRNAPTFEQLFAATGGARLGMRARASQKGKILRTEQAPQAPLSSNVSAANSVAITGAAQTKIIPKVKSSEENDPEAANEVKKEKKKKRKQDSLSEEMEEGGPASECVETSCVQDGQQSKKSKKERKSKEKSKDKR